MGLAQKTEKSDRFHADRCFAGSDAKPAAAVPGPAVFFDICSSCHAGNLVKLLVEDREAKPLVPEMLIPLLAAVPGEVVGRVPRPPAAGAGSPTPAAVPHRRAVCHQEADGEHNECDQGAGQGGRGQ